VAFREADVRDSLASRLDLIEDELELVDTEVSLPNAVGTRGYVDILARDRFGNIVVIEVKRSDQTAREALQEILKYAELLRREHGHPEHRLRLAIASTSWHELTAPFSALERFCPYPLLGIEIQVDEEDGQVLGSFPVEGLPPSMRGQIGDEGMVLLWTVKEKRDSAWEHVVPALSKLGLQDFLGAEIDYEGDDEKVIYSYGLALVPGRVSEEAGRMAGLLEDGEMAPGIGPEEIASGLGVDDAPSLESEAMSRLMEEILEVSESAESLSPEGWVRLEQRGWILRRLHRTGTFAAADYIKDEELAAQIGGREGLNRTLMEIAITPSLKLAWDEAVLRAQLVLEGNPVWQQGLEQWLTEREVEEPRDYRLRLYSLQDIVRALVGLATFRDGRWIDTLKILTGNEEAPERALGGLIVWGGGGSPPLDAVRDVLPGGLDQLGFELAIAGPDLQSDLMKAMDLRYALFERSQKDAGPRRYGDDAAAGVATAQELRSLFEFVSAHAKSLQDLRMAVEATSVGYFG
jgi:hypothetical protein